MGFERSPNEKCRIVNNFRCVIACDYRRITKIYEVVLLAQPETDESLREVLGRAILIALTAQ
jgi:hypothetical protein